MWYEKELQLIIMYVCIFISANMPHKKQGTKVQKRHYVKIKKDLDSDYH